MSENSRTDFARKCYHGEPPACACACPFGLDTIALIKRIQKGRFNSAYALYRDHVLFPGIVCRICDQPCRDACVRAEIDEGIAMRFLERAVVEQAQQTAPRKLNLPKKDKGVAIVGAGPCGLSCACNLVIHGYDVTLYDASDRIGGNLSEALAPEIYLPEFEHQMQFLEYRLVLDTKIDDLDGLAARHDAVLIATGKGGNTFGLLPGLNRESLGSERPGIFVAGGAAGADTKTASFEHGIRVSQSIETYLQINRMHELSFLRKDKVSRLVVNTTAIQPQKSFASARHDKDDAIREALRCVLCDCEECKRSCEMLQWFRQLPKSIVADVQDSLRLTSEMKVHGPRPLGSVTKRLVSSCTDCGLCNEVCTENIDMGAFLIESRRIMHQNGTLPPAFHDYWLRDMAHALGESAHLARNASGHDGSDHVFFPGCQLGASDPDYVKKAYAYLLEKHPRTGLILGCCGIPAAWAGDEALATSTIDAIRDSWTAMGSPTVIVACPTCRKMFSQYLPEIRQKSLYEILDTEGTAPGQVHRPATISVFDPCASRYDEAMQRHVRSLVKKAGLTIAELPYRERTAQCCGNGGHIYSANPELADAIARKDIGLGEHPYITYCTNCRDIFAYHGKSCRHVLDLFFGGSGEWRRPPAIGERRDNREILKADLLKEVWKEEASRQSVESNLIVGFEEMDKLNRNLISVAEVAEVIEMCEASGDKLLDPRNDYYIGHRKKGLLTYWVFYRVEDGRYRLLNAYCHRMAIAGE